LLCARHDGVGGAEVHLYLLEVSVWLRLGRSTRGECSAFTHYVGSLVGLDRGALEKRKIMSKYLQKYDTLLLLSLSKLSVGGFVGMDMDVLEKRKIMSNYLQKYDTLLLLSLSKLSVGGFVGMDMDVLEKRKIMSMYQKNKTLYYYCL
jgi:hypothetical protein